MLVKFFLVNIIFGQNKIWVKICSAEKNLAEKNVSQKKFWSKKNWVFFLHESSSLVELRLHSENQLHR